MQQKAGKKIEIETEKSYLPPVCSNRKKVRDDNGKWERIEVYIRNHSEADFSHGLCPECARKMYADPIDED